MADAPAGKEFIFKLPNGTVVGRAKNLEELIYLIKTAPIDAVLYHTKGKHFSPWLEMLGLKNLADKLAKTEINDKTARLTLVRLLRSK
ncbi:MAG: hypothetical protein N3D10_00660 [Candidatus Micrarchaeota archaeon]|nr:hypothetical protein [Candidatus Micrarchaeota archaeon]